jgi:hypothetical protein
VRALPEILDDFGRQPCDDPVDFPLLKLLLLIGIMYPVAAVLCGLPIALVCLIRVLPLIIRCVIVLWRHGHCCRLLCVAVVHLDADGDDVWWWWWVVAAAVVVMMFDVERVDVLVVILC